MSNHKLSKWWTTCLLLVLTCSAILAESEFTDKESSRSHEQRLNARPHHGEVTSLSTEGRRGGGFREDGLQMSSSGSRKEKKINNERNNDDDDDKKTLSQQVKEGKYGLIQNEIFATEPKRPGVVSYTSNSDMPKDTMKNFGGLDEDEIWLAENHVLVLRGGKLPEGEGQNGLEEKWPPIDDYQAPSRPVKIPLKPKVPPPFPIQLSDGGPIKILGSENNQVSENAVNMTFSQGFLPGEGPFFPLFSNKSAPFMPAISFMPMNSSKGTLQFKPIIIPDKQQTKQKVDSKKDDDSPSPFYPALPPGAVIVPPPGNRTDYDDEEDQSIYYPPPYSFVYDMKNESTLIPPGPLVPGIILPPPPDFFSLLDDEKKSTTKDKHKSSSLENTSKPASSVINLPRRVSTKLYKGGSSSITSSPQITTQKTKVSTTRPSTASRYSPKTSLRKPINSTVYTIPRTVIVEVTSTTPATIKPTTYEIEAVVGNQVSETSTEKNSWTAVVSSKTVPLLATFYATTTPSPSTEQQIETTPSTVRQTTRVPEQTSYFFYGEPSNEASGASGSNEDTNVYYTPTTTESSSYYKVNEFSQKPEDQYYNRVEEPQAPQRPNAIKIIESLVKDPRVYQYTQSSKDRHVQTNPASSLYVSTISADRPRSSSYVTVTPAPPSGASVFYSEPQVGLKFDYDQQNQQKSKSKAIYQYSFEADGYNKERKIGKKKKQQSEREISYRYPEAEIVPILNPQTPLNPLRYSYKSHRPIEYFTPTTIRSPVDVSTTLEPHRVYITKQDEQLLDDVTKEYFTMFGKKLTGKRVQSTTPIYSTNSVTEKPKYTYTSSDFTDRGRYKVPKVKVHYGGLSSISRPPFSLQSDTLVNFKHPLPSINPDSEFITVIGPDRTRTGKVLSQPIVQEEFQARQVLQADNQVRDYTGQHILQQSQQQNQNDFIPMEGPRGLGQKSPGFSINTRPVSLANDEGVNYQNPRPPLNPDAEYISPVPGQPVNRYRNKANSYFAYNLPGDGGHFYFLTPQAIPQRQTNAGSYLYPSNSRVSRLVRRRRGPT